MAKAILGSVGKGGRNRFEDVVVVQYLLNCVPAKKGGPEAELALDGICGPLTTGAIGRYQSANLGFADGRVDAGGKTFSSLTGFDPYPNQDLNLPSRPSGEKKWSGKKGGTPSSNSWDPWGYYNPAGENYMKEGKAPPSKMGENAHEGIKGSSKQSGKQGGTTAHEGIKQTGPGHKQPGKQGGGGLWAHLTDLAKGLGMKESGAPPQPESVKGFGKDGGGMVAKF
jgi:hypothetical protein